MEMEGDNGKFILCNTIELEADSKWELRMRDKKGISKVLYLLDPKNYCGANRCKKSKSGENIINLILVNLHLLRVAYQVNGNI